MNATLPLSSLDRRPRPAAPTDPLRAQAAFERGALAQRERRFEAARDAFQEVTRLAPDDGLGWINLASALFRLGALADSVQAARRGTELLPHLALGWLMLADGLRLRHDQVGAADAYAQAERCGHEDTDAYVNQGAVLNVLGHRTRALEVLLKASAIQPHHPAVHGMLAMVFRQMNLMAEAVECLKTLRALVPGHLQALSTESFEKRHLCFWDDIEADTATLSAMLESASEEDYRSTTCFSYLSLPMSPALQCKAARMDSRINGWGVQPLAPVDPTSRRGTPLRVGYVSGDLREHPVAQLLVEALEQRRPADGQVLLYDHGGPSDAPVRQRLMKAADAFVSLDGLSDREAAERIRADGIDVLVDLQGHTKGHRLAIFSHRAAPVQASYLGFPATSGDPSIDYLVGDPIVSPVELASHYTEKIAQLPLCFQPNGRWRPLPDPAWTREQVGLPSDAFVMCAFNHTYKILPHAFDAWCELMHRVPRAVLWLKEINGQLHANVRREIRSRGIDPSRVHFAGYVSYADHFSRLALADVFVDTWPYNAHTTAGDALWAGVPVVTVFGDTYASRVAASVLNAAGLGELAYADPADYVRSLEVLATEPEVLASIREHLRLNRMTLPLFDGATRAAELAALFQRMKQRWLDGQAPDHLLAAG